MNYAEFTLTAGESILWYQRSSTMAAPWYASSVHAERTWSKCDSGAFRIFVSRDNKILTRKLLESRVSGKQRPFSRYPRHPQYWILASGNTSRLGTIGTLTITNVRPAYWPPLHWTTWHRVYLILVSWRATWSIMICRLPEMHTGKWMPQTRFREPGDMQIPTQPMRFVENGSFMSSWN